jgi:hypothetical protein
MDSAVNDRPGSERASGELSPRVLWWAAGLIPLLTVGLTAVLWWSGIRGLTGRELVTARFDAVKIALSVGLGCGGAVVLYLTWRRQRSTERVAVDTRYDSEQRRLTDLYSKAAEMLGAEQAAVRMAGLYALERLAQDHPEQRRAVVNVLCAYLRMPYLSPDEPQPTADRLAAGAELISERERRERSQELEVRFAVQGLLREHVHHVPENLAVPSTTFWGIDLSVNLGEGTLVKMNLQDLRVHPNTRLAGTTFIGDQRFDGAAFTGPTWFRRARFTGDLILDGARFSGETDFREAVFEGRVSFAGVTAAKGFALHGARAKRGQDSIWPQGWTTQPTSIGDDEDWEALREVQ